METIITKDQVRELLPQKKPFAMVDFLYEYSERNIVTGYEVEEDNVFIEDGKFNESGLIENIAQSMALHTHYSYFLRNLKAPEGYIGSVKNVKIHGLPEPGNVIRTSVNIIQEFMGVTLVHAVTTCGDKMVATSQMKTVIAQV